VFSFPSLPPPQSSSHHGSSSNIELMRFSIWKIDFLLFELYSRNWTEFKSFFDWFSSRHLSSCMRGDKKIYANCLAKLTTSDKSFDLISYWLFSSPSKECEKSSSWCDNLLIQKVD
jgi:hypothetical protein